MLLSLKSEFPGMARAALEADFTSGETLVPANCIDFATEIDPLLPTKSSNTTTARHRHQHPISAHLQLPTSSDFVSVFIDTALDHHIHQSPTTDTTTPSLTPKRPIDPSTGPSRPHIPTVQNQGATVLLLAPTPWHLQRVGYYATPTSEPGRIRVFY